MYFESKRIVSGRNGGVIKVAWMTAAILLIWLDWWVPGILRVLLRGSLGANQIPLPLRALSLPLL